MEQYDNYGSQNPDYRVPVQPPRISSGAKFVQNYLGFVIMGLYLINTLILGVDMMSPQLILFSFWPLGIIAAGAVAATRIRGPDLSMGAMAMLSSVIVANAANEGSIIAGIIAVILVCLFYGMINGAIISFLGAPSVVVTILTAAMMRVTTFMMSGFVSIPAPELTTQQQSQYVIMFVIAITVAIAALAITKRLPVSGIGQKRGAVPKLMDMLGYALVAIISGIAGYVWLRRLGVASPAMGSGYEVYVILIFAAVQSSRLLKNNVIALCYGLVVAFVLIMSNMAIMRLGLSHVWQSAIEAGLALQLVCVACAANGGWRAALSASIEPVGE